MNMKLAPVFCDGVVLQKNKPLYVFGSGEGKAKVEFLGNEFSGTSFDDKWEVCLGKYDSGGPYEIKITLIDNNGEQVITLNDVYVGTVLLIAGQSNVQWTISNAQDEGLNYEIESNPLIRTFVTSRLEKHNKIDAKDGWVVLNKNTSSSFSALGLHLAEHLQKARGEAVGFVGCWQGGSIIQTWLPREICYRADLYTSAEVMYKDSPELYYDWNKPSLCYEYQFKTLCPFAFDSVVWYQGCSNAGNGTSGIYGKLLLELITRWRYDLRQNLHFTVVEIANCDFGADDWGIIQKAQTDAPNYIDGVTTVESKDISESYTIHPVDKRPLAQRIFDEVYNK